MKKLYLVFISSITLYAGCADSGLEQTHQKSIETHYESQDMQVSNELGKLKDAIDKNTEVEKKNVALLNNVFNVNINKNIQFRNAIMEIRQLIEVYR